MPIAPGKYSQLAGTSKNVAKELLERNNPKKVKSPSRKDTIGKIGKSRLQKSSTNDEKMEKEPQLAKVGTFASHRLASSSPSLASAHDMTKANRYGKSAIYSARVDQPVSLTRNATGIGRTVSTDKKVSSHGFATGGFSSRLMDDMENITARMNLKKKSSQPF
ncbi:hypothetical protein niasHS_005720 [Heterodera schachtii]|uniref:Uncharacterized protein n=1 Tax=Heterodera schachtii TaxID=97005 RepID=A0ABD2JZ83_HETSC